MSRSRHRSCDRLCDLSLDHGIRAMIDYVTVIVYKNVCQYLHIIYPTY